MMAGYAIFFGWLSLERYWAYEMHALDMGNMGQAAWNTIHGHPFYFTNMRLAYHIEAWNTTTRLSFHVEYLFPLISLVYLLYPHPESLLVLQTLALTVGALPVYLLARDILGGSWLPLVFAAIYLLFPSLEALNLYEFHAVALATPLLLFGFLFLHRRRPVPFLLCCVAAMGTKEEIGLVVGLFGLYAAIVQRQRRLGFALAAAGIFWSLFSTLVVEHHYRQPGTLTYMRSRYGYLLYSRNGKQEHGLRAVLDTLGHDPGVFFRVLFIWPKLGYIERLLAPVGYLALLAPVILLLGAPTFAINLFSNDFSMYSALGDNSAELIAVVMIAAVLGTRLLIDLFRLWLHPRRIALALGLYLLAQALWSQHVNGYTPIGTAFKRPVVGAHQRLADRFVAMVPPSVPVSTQDQLNPHLSSRHYLYLFEDTGRTPPLAPANYVLLDVSAPTYPLPSYQLHDAADGLLRHGWGIKAADDGLILLQKGLTRQVPPTAFYRYAEADSARVPALIRGRSGNLKVLGYARTRSDLPNHDIPNLNYTVYLRPVARLHQDLQPVIFETVGADLVACVKEPLGLAWLPTSHWRPGHTYAVRMDPLETNWNVPGTARLSMEVVPVSAAADPSITCSALWRSHTRLFGVGSLDITY